MSDTRKKKGRLFYFTALFAVLIICLIALLPVLLSSQWGKQRLLAMAAQHLPGTIQIESWSLSWFGKQNITGLSYVDHNGDIRVADGYLVIEKGLFALLLNRSEVGTITLTGPDIEIALPAPGSSRSGAEPPPQSGDGSDGDDKPSAPGEGPLPDAPFTLPPISGRLVVADGTIGVVTAGKTVIAVARDVDVTLALNAATDDISYTLAMVSPDLAGRLSAQGRVTTAAATTLGAIASTGELSLQTWNISTFLELAATYGEVPRGGGILAGTLSHDGSLDGGIAVDGAIDCSDLHLSGGVLGDDQPSIDLASVVFTSRIGRDLIELDSLTLSSPPASGSLSGMLAGDDLRLDTGLTVDLAILAGQIPHTLNLQEGLRIGDGMLSLTGRVMSEQGRHRFDINTRVEGLAGAQDGRNISLSEPFTFRAVGSQDGDGLTLEQFSIESSFLRGRGQGDLTNMEVSLEADLGAALAEVEQFVALPDYPARGRLTGSLKAKRNNESTVSVTAELASESLLVQQGDTVIIPGKPLQLSVVVDLPLSAELDFGGIDIIANPRLAYQSWLGNGSARADLFEVTTSRLAGLSFSGQTDLAGLSALLGALGVLPEGLTMGGANSSSIALDYSGAGIELASLTSETSDFVLAMDGKAYRDKKVVIETSGKIDTGQRSLSLAPLHIDSATGVIDLERFSIGDWGAAGNTLSGSGQARFDIDTVLDVMADWYVLPPDVSTTGIVELTMAGAPAGDGQMSYDIAAELRNFSLAGRGAQILSDETARIVLDGTREPSTGATEFNRLAINTPLVELTAAGFVRPAEGGEEFAISGDLSMDLARIGALVRGFSELDLVMAGGGARPFTLRGIMSGDQRTQWWNHIDVSGAAQADMVKLMGLELSGLEIPIAISGGLARADVQGTINQGTLAVQPLLDMRNEQPLLTIPEGRVISDMQLTREVAESFLARIHPLFMGAGRMSGAVDLNLERFYWPLGDDNADKRQFSGRIDLAEVQLQSSAMLGTLLQTLGVDNTTLDLSGEQIFFAAKDGRITTTPLTTNLSDTDLIVSGSMGFDTSLDYLVQAEVTQALVGAEVYQYLRGTVIRVPIGGTLAKPDISVQTVQRTATDLINQAARQRLQEEAGKLLEGLFN